MYELSVGSKVFLLGEYQVLGGGAAFLTILEPRFRLLVYKGQGNLTGIEVGSPADRFFKTEFEFFKEWDFEYKDPHGGRGGFGSSTAQIALLQGFREGFESFRSFSQVDFDLRKLHKKYLGMAQLQGNIQPSGADLIGQFQGGLVEVDLGAGKIQRHSWPFPQWQILFFSTGRKLATHQHLQQLEHCDLQSLKLLYQKAMDAFKDQKASAFAQGFRDYQVALSSHGWQSSETGVLLNQIQGLEGVEAAKGCGAMGADVVAVMIDSGRVKKLIEAIEAFGLRYVGNLEDRTEGFAWKWIPENYLELNNQESSCPS